MNLVNLELTLVLRVEENSVSLDNFDESIDAEFEGEQEQFALLRGEVSEHFELELLQF